MNATTNQPIEIAFHLSRLPVLWNTIPSEKIEQCFDAISSSQDEQIKQLQESIKIEDSVQVNNAGEQ